MTQLHKAPLQIFDEPAVYNQFTGGINLSSSIEDLRDNELRDCVNMTYKHTSLEKREGATKVAGLLTSSIAAMFKNIQGIFLFTAKQSFIVLAADGQLFYSVYIPGYDLELVPLPIIHDPSEKQTPLNGAYQLWDLEVFDFIRERNLAHNGYVYDDGTNKRLIFQNTRNIEASAYGDQLFVATGTRICVVKQGESNNELEAEIMIPYLPNGHEVNLVGFNLLSPYPDIFINNHGRGPSASIHGIAFTPFLNEEGEHESHYNIEAIMILPDGRNTNDYHFKWEVYVFDEDQDKMIWKSLSTHNSSSMFKYNSLGNSKIRQYYYDKEKVELVRCTFTDLFEVDTEGKKVEDDGDWIPSRVGGASTGSFSFSPINLPEKTNDSWRIIQSCSKILADGNKFLFYDDAFNSGQWFKTVIDKPNYITQRGGLSFKTNKNERTIKAIHFKGVKVIFSYNDYVGGNISLVYGNGDDVVDEHYSPYIRKIINTEITSDSADTIQIAENLLLFKFKETVYAIEGSDLSSEIVKVYSLNDKIKSSQKAFQIPWTEPCLSELTDEYYALIWKQKHEYINGELIIKRPAMRIKMYYKLAYELQNKIFFPWLRDEGEIFNATKVITINGKSTLFSHMNLIQFPRGSHLDLEDPYESSIKLKGYDLNYPNITKMIQNISLAYYRDHHCGIDLRVIARNEANHLLLDQTSRSQQDLPTVQDGITSGKIGDVLIDTKIYSPYHSFPLLYTSVEIIINGKGNFALHEIAFHFRTLNIPKTTQYDLYSNIIRTDSPHAQIINRVHSEFVEINNIVKEEEPLPKVITGDQIEFHNSLDEKADIVLDAADPCKYDDSPKIQIDGGIENE